MGNYEQSFFNFLEAYKLMERAENLFGQGYYLNNIDALFDDQHNYEKAIEYYNRSFIIKEITKDSSGMASTSFNVGLLYYNLLEYEKALGYFKRSHNSISYQRSAVKKIRALNNIAQTYLEMNELSKAKKALMEAGDQADAIAGERESIDYYSVLGRIFLAEEQSNSAMYYNDKTLKLSKSIGIPVKTRRGLVLKSAIFEKSGQIDLALLYLKEGQMYNDSIVSEANVNAMGLSDEQLGEKLFVSKSTVKTHLRRLYSKLLVNNRAQAVAIAHKYGIIGVV